MVSNVRTLSIVLVSAAAGVLVGLLIPWVHQSGTGLDNHSRNMSVKELAIQHLAREMRDVSSGSEVDHVFEVVDWQPDGRIMLVGFSRLVQPEPGGINRGQFWLEVAPRVDRDGYDVKSIVCELGITENGSPWATAKSSP